MLKIIKMYFIGLRVKLCSLLVVMGDTVRNARFLKTKKVSTFSTNKASDRSFLDIEYLTRVVISYEIYETSFGEFHKFHMN